MLNVDNTDDAVPPDHGRGQKRFEGIFGKVFEVFESRIVVSLARDCEEPAFSCNPTREALVKFQTDFPDAVRVGVVRRAQHQSVPVEQIQQARVRLHELDHQADNAAQCRMEIRIANHKPADTLKETQLLFNAFELMLEIPNSAGHDLYYGSPKTTAAGLVWT